MTRNPARSLRALLVLGMVAAAAGAHHYRVAGDEQALYDLAVNIIDEQNAEDPLPMPEEGPEADVEIETFCSYRYILFGEKSGKIRLIIKPREHAPVDKMTPIVYLCEEVDGQWTDIESYSEH